MQKFAFFLQALQRRAGWAQVSIVPRGSAALGFAQYLPSENLLMTTAQMADMTCMALGGRAAEQVLLGKISTGAPCGWARGGRCGMRARSSPAGRGLLGLSACRRRTAHAVSMADLRAGRGRRRGHRGDRTLHCDASRSACPHLSSELPVTGPSQP